MRMDVRTPIISFDNPGRYYEELFRLEIMRRWRATKHENRVQRACLWKRVSLCYKQRWMAIAWSSENRYGDIDPVG